MKLVILVPLFLLFVACSFGAHVPEGFMTCGSECISDYNCSRYLGNPCTFCDRGKCSPMCGVGCGSSEDCIGGGNPCTYCSERRICINPVPQCGSFCGGTDEACRFASGECGGILENCCTCHPSNFTLGCGNYTMINRCGKSCSTSSDCANSGDGCVYCTDGVCSKDQSLCGEVCSGSGQCSASASCPQCVGYFCSPPASCGQVCLSSGQCQSNSGNCKACIGTICSDYAPCGGSCGGDDWCTPTCPVCSFAKCSSRKEHEARMASATPLEIEAGFKEMKRIHDETVAGQIPF